MNIVSFVSGELAEQAAAVTKAGAQTNFLFFVRNGME
jgi:hypothetical protein